MSTKIYNGFELQGFTLDSALSTFMQRREDIDRLVELQRQTMLVRMAVSRHDRQALGMVESCTTSFIHDAMNNMMERQRSVRTTGGRDPMMDWSFDVVVFFFESRLFGITFTEHNLLRNVVASIPGYREFSYWDNTDMPDDISESQWEERNRIWKAILGKEGIPSRVGYTYTFYDTNTWFSTPPRSLVSELTPNIEDRVNDVFLEYLEMSIRDRIPTDRTRSYAVYSWLREFSVSQEGIRIRNRVVQTLADNMPTPEVLFFSS